MMRTVVEYEYNQFVQFDKTNPNWCPSPEYNAHFLKAMQSFMCQLVLARGSVFLNEYFDYIGIPRTQSGQILGWDKDNPVNMLWKTHDDYIMIDLGQLGVIISNLD